MKERVFVGSRLRVYFFWMDSVRWVQWSFWREENRRLGQFWIWRLNLLVSIGSYRDRV